MAISISEPTSTILKNTWKGIRSIITIKNLSSNIPKNLSSNSLTISNKVEI